MGLTTAPGISSSGPPPGLGYILLNANGTPQTGASPFIELAVGGYSATRDSNGTNLLLLQDGAGTSADNIIAIGPSPSSPGAGNTAIDAPGGTAGKIIIAPSGAVVTFGGNVASGFGIASQGTATSSATYASYAVTLNASTWNTSGAGSVKAQTGTILLSPGTAGNPEQYPIMTFNIVDSSASGGNAYLFQVAGVTKFSLGSGGNINTLSGIIKQYDAVATAGLGVPAIFGAGLGVSLGTTSTAVCSYSGATGMYLVKWVLSCKTSSTPNLTLTYTDPQAGAQTVTLYNSAMVGGAVENGVYPIWAATGTAIAVAGTDSVAAGDIYASAVIAEVQ